MSSSPQAQQESSTREILAGLVERVTFHKAENGFCVLRIKARGHRDLITVIGHAAVIAAGEWVTASGEWVNDRTHGQQFRSRFMRTSAPTSIEGVEKYLGSGMIRGIGPVYAKKLVRAFGEKVFDVIEAEPDRLREVTGIGPVRAKRITGGWAEQKIVREIMVFLHSHGVGTARAVHIFKTYGDDAVQVMTENPYRLARDIRGIGFKTADAIAMKLGIEKTALIRVRAGIAYALTEAMDEGHCGLPSEELISLTKTLLEVPAELVETALGLELEGGAVIADDLDDRCCVFLAGLYRAEREIAEKLKALATGKPPRPVIDADKAIPWVEQRTKLALADSQREAVRVALVSKVLVITGGPGVGKTTLVNSILKILLAKTIAISLCAPTGRAAKRLSESTGLEAKTIHRLLETDQRTGSFRRNEDKATELSDFSVCTTWGVIGKNVYLLGLLRRRLEYPALKRAVCAQQNLHGATTVLIEDKASGTQLIQDLIDDGCHGATRYQPTTDKIMRMHAQTAMIENGFVYIPETAPWLAEYLHEISVFPKGKHDDQVDSTAQFLDWFKTPMPYSGLLEYYRREAEN